MEPMLRTSWADDSSKAKNRQRSPFSQAARARWAATLVLPVPAEPEQRMVVPLK